MRPISESSKMRSNRIFEVIRDFETLFPEEFVKCDIKRCGHCGATGLANKYQMDNFCTMCGGIGYKGFEKIQGDFICRTCNGGGCNRCKQKGIVDWVTHANGRDMMQKGEKWI
jgi:hypothetical protein